jgi:four helix bundle protein
MAHACDGSMRASCLEELLVYQKAIATADAISAILPRQQFQRDFKLRHQLAASSERVASLIAEGFSQSTDRHFAEYLFRSRGSSKETRTQLRIALGRKYVTPDELNELSRRYNEIERMLTGLIKHLRSEDRKMRS